jgi:sn-glycerol 3-phosphate transport system permease protein
MRRYIPSTINHLILLIGLSLMIVPIWIIFASSTHTSLFINTNGLQFSLGDNFIENYSKSFLRRQGFLMKLLLLKCFLIAL